MVISIEFHRDQYGEMIETCLGSCSGFSTCYFLHLEPDLIKFSGDETFRTFFFQKVKRNEVIERTIKRVNSCQFSSLGLTPRGNY